MEPVDPAEITRLLQAWGHGDRTALDALTPRVYDELRPMARRYMQNERLGRRFRPQLWSNEVYLRLVDVTGANCRTGRISSRYLPT
jgi:hypothetical protein